MFEPPFLMRGGRDYLKNLSYAESVMRFLITAVFWGAMLLRRLHLFWFECGIDLALT